MDRRGTGDSTAGSSRVSTRTPAGGTWGWSSLGWTSLNAHQGAWVSVQSSFAWQLSQIGICWLPQGSIAEAG